MNAGWGGSSRSRAGHALLDEDRGLPLGNANQSSLRVLQEGGVRAVSADFHTIRVDVRGVIAGKNRTWSRHQKRVGSADLLPV